MIAMRVVGFLYLLSGGWCAFAPELASGFLGFSLSNTTGLAEFFSVYGGLQVGLGLALILSSFVAEYIESALYFSWVFSTSLFLFRVISIGLYGVQPELMAMAILEALIAVVMWGSWLRQKRKSSRCHG